jgi:phospholipid/cholesterol/gamma-HCH transport system substrate-binding protein
MDPRRRRLRLGLFVVGTGVLFAALLLFILQNSLGHARASFFILFTQNVKGMVIGSKVNFQGVPIGVVADMRFQDGKTRVELRVDPTRADIQDLTRARMDKLLVTGQVTVELEGYGPTGTSLPPGSYIEPKEDPLHSLTASLPEVVDRAASVLARLDRVLGDAEALLGPHNRARIDAMLANAEAASREIAQRTLPAATAMFTEARATATQATATATSAQHAVEALGRLEGELRGVLHEARALAAGVRGPAQAALTGLRTTFDDLRALARQLKLAPDSLLFGVRPAAPAGGER